MYMNFGSIKGSFFVSKHLNLCTISVSFVLLLEQLQLPGSIDLRAEENSYDYTKTPINHCTMNINSTAVIFKLAT